MESRLSKKDIIYLYLNQIYLGQGAYGVGMAAENLFPKKSTEFKFDGMYFTRGSDSGS